MTHTSTEQERAEFEAWWRGYTKSIKAPRFECGAYIFPAANTAWNTWQAARRAPVVPHTKVKPDFYWDSEKQHHVPTLLIEFEPVPAGDPCDAKGWTDRDNLAAALAAAPQPPEAAQLDDTNVADMHQVFDLKGEE